MTQTVDHLVPAAGPVGRPPAPSRGRPLDLGRLAVVPVATALLVLNGAGVLQALSAGVEGPRDALGLLGRVLTSLFYVLVVAVYLRRSRARATGTARRVQIAAVLASWLPFALPLLPGAPAPTGLLVVADLLIVAGLGWSVVALRTIDRSFSIVPQARALVQHGPYRVVRHPLYLGELVAAAGIVLAHPSVGAATVLVVLALLQGWRLVHEEAVLEATLPEYAAYRRRTARLVPGVF